MEAVEEPKKSFTSDVVKKIVEREKAKAFERGKREALMELQQQSNKYQRNNNKQLHQQTTRSIRRFGGYAANVSS